VLYIFSAIYAEAKAVIRERKLRKVPGQGAFPQFADAAGGILLTLSGTGNAAAAAAAAATLAARRPGPNDIVLNLGTCAGRPEQQGNVYLCNCLKELSSGRTFYPDMRAALPFPEAALVTGNAVSRHPDSLYDMEATALYQAAGYFVGPHQMVFLKAVSDAGTGERMGAELLEQTMNRPEILDAVDTLWRISMEEPQRALTEEQEALLQQAEKDLCCSSTMAHTLRQYFTYAALAGGAPETALRAMYEDGRLPAASRQEGKKHLAELEQALL